LKISVFTELQIPRPWEPGVELKTFQEGLEQVELADKLGFHAAWCVEHHFLEEYAHCSAPEVFLAACAGRTKNIRLGHGVMLLPPGFNPSARCAERIAALDLVSNGRVEFGTGESSSEMELGGFGVARAAKREMWLEALEAVCRMMVEEPFQGHVGKHINMPVRNVVPKPVQKPHPPLWVACSKRDTILLAAKLGIGALTFAFISPEESDKWVHDYYETLEKECQPVGFDVNPSIALTTMMMCGPTREKAIEMDRDGSNFFTYAVGYYYVFGEHDPGKSSIWESYAKTVRGTDQVIKTGFGDTSTGVVSPCVGSPKEIREALRMYERHGVDQVLLQTQGGRNRHEVICESLQRFASEVLPEFQDRDPKLSKQKAERLEPVVERAMKRKPPSKFAKASGPTVVKAAGGQL
jgi:alkanesulfonate monooxygenase SsuD/methylene tetrahydromethanopterin reductase-like flavin-dependent oxidoreductase (luciferase family)